MSPRPSNTTPPAVHQTSAFVAGVAEDGATSNLTGERKSEKKSKKRGVMFRKRNSDIPSAEAEGPEPGHEGSRDQDANNDQDDVHALIDDFVEGDGDDFDDDDNDDDDSRGPSYAGKSQFIDVTNVYDEDEDDAETKSLNKSKSEFQLSNPNSRSKDEPSGPGAVDVRESGDAKPPPIAKRPKTPKLASSGKASPSKLRTGSKPDPAKPLAEEKNGARPPPVTKRPRTPKLSAVGKGGNPAKSPAVVLSTIRKNLKERSPKAASAVPRSNSTEARDLAGLMYQQETPVGPSKPPAVGAKAEAHSGPDRGPGYVRVDPDSPSGGAGVRREPEFPGERTGDVLLPGQEVAFKTKVPFLFKDGASEISINFYELMDGRGWIHDYDPKGTNGKPHLIVLGEEASPQVLDPASPEGEEKQSKTLNDKAIRSFVQGTEGAEDKAIKSFEEAASQQETDEKPHPSGVPEAERRGSNAE